MVCIQVIGEDNAVAFAGSQGNFELNAMRPIIINNFLHSARILGDACEKLRHFSVEGTRLNRKRIDEMVDRSLMLVTALSPVIGYDKASAIAHKANDEDLTLKEAALASGDIDERRFDEIVDPKKMVGHGARRKLTGAIAGMAGASFSCLGLPRLISLGSHAPKQIRRTSLMEFGMFHEFPALPGRSEADAFDEAFAQVDAAERWGLDAMWLAELHGDPQRSVLSAPLGIASAIAARTQRIKIGIAVQVLPLCHPLRLAEEAATVDQLSRGRLIFGVGRSGVVAHLRGLRHFLRREPRPLRRNLGDHQAGLDRSRVFLRRQILQLQGRRPWCRSRISSPIRRSASPPPAPDTFPAIGELGCPIFVAVRHGTFSELVPSIKAYREACRAAGHPGRGRGLSAGAGLCRRDRGAGPLRAARQPDAFLPASRPQLAIDSARRSGGAGRRAAGAGGPSGCRT